VGIHREACGEWTGRRLRIDLSAGMSMDSGQGEANEKTFSGNSADSRMKDAFKQIYPHTGNNGHE
jgi:hypothetical protein